MPVSQGTYAIEHEECNSTYAYCSITDENGELLVLFEPHTSTFQLIEDIAILHFRN